MDILRAFLEQQLLLLMFIVIGAGYAVGAVNIRGFNLGIGAVLFVGLGVGMLVPNGAPPALLGSLGLVMFVYGIGIQYGEQFFAGLASPFGLKVNALALASHLVAIGVCYVAYAVFSVAPEHIAGLFAGALTSTPTLQAAIGAVGNNEPALGYSVAYPFGLIAPILCMYFANVWLKPRLTAATSAGLELQEIVVRSAQVVGRPLSELTAVLPAGVQIVVVRQAHQNRVPSPDIVLAQGDVLALAGESVESLDQARALIGESATGRIAKDRLDLDYFRFFVSHGGAVGVRVGDLKIAGVSEHSIIHVRRGDADLLPRPDLILEYGDRVGVMAKREDRSAVRAYFGDSIKSTAEFSYVSLGVGMALGVLLGILPIPVPGLGTLSLGVAGGPLVVALILSRFGRTGSWVWTMPVSANVTLRNFGLTIFLAQIGLASGPKFIATVQQLGPLFLAVGAAIILIPMMFNMLAGHFILKLRFDDLLGAAAGGVGGNPAILAFGSKLVPTDRTDITYATVFPAATITKIVLVQVMLAMMGEIMRTLDIALKISLVLFMVGNLLDMGLLLKVQAAIGALRNLRFVSLGLLWGFILLPGLAYLLTLVVPLEPPYAIGLLLLALAPCAPFLPPMVDRARGDMGYTAAFMLLASVATVVYMPLAVPVLVDGFSAGAWTIAKPLLFFLLVPLAIGMAIQSRSASMASRLQPIVKKVTGVDTLLMLGLCVVIYGKAFLGLVGSYAIGVQILFFSVAVVGPYWLGLGLPRGQRIVLSLGMCTRNIGAALAPLFAVPDVDQRAIVMVSFGVLMQAVFSFAAASYFGRRTVSEPGAAQC